METDTLDNRLSERRQHPKLRSIFPDARVRIDHFFHQHDEWAGSSIDYLALRVIHEAYPDLSHEEVRVLMNAVEQRVQQEVATRGS